MSLEKFRSLPPIPKSPFDPLGIAKEFPNVMCWKCFCEGHDFPFEELVEF